MQTVIDPDEFETITEWRTCPFHQLHPGEPFAGCTCSGGIGSRRRTPAEISKIKAERRRKEEDEILAKAELIKAQRKAETKQ